MTRSAENDANKICSPTIADRGRAAAARKSAKTLTQIARAKRVIVADLEKNRGVYPYAGGNLTAEEVLRRAGLDRSLLQKKRHKELREGVKAWLTEIEGKQIKGSTVVREAVTERAEEAEDELALVRQRWVEAELEFTEQANEIVSLTRRCAELEKENSLLKLAVSRGKIVQPNPDGSS